MALITTAEQLKPHLPTPYGNKLENLPDFAIAEEQQLIPFIGHALYEALQESNLSTEMQTLLLLCRGVIAPFAYINHVDFLQVQLSDTGLIAFEPEGTRKAYKWENNKMRESLTSLGYSKQEMLLQFLHRNSEDFAEWSEADYNTSPFTIIRNGSELAAVLPMYQAHRSYMALRPLFVEVGDSTISGALSDEFYEAFSAQIKEGNLEGLDAQLYVLLQKAAARFAMQKAAQMDAVRYTPGVGFTVGEAAKDSSNEDRKQASANMIDRYANEMLQSARMYLDKANKLLNENASSEVFALYFVSSVYKNPHSGGIKLRTNRRGMFPAS